MFYHSLPRHISKYFDTKADMNINALTPDRRRGSRAVAEDNVPPRFELFLLDDGEKKMTEETDTRKFSFTS